MVVDAREDMQSGVFGEMMLTYLQGKGGEGIIVDGVIRDSQPALETGLGMWVRGFTPNYHIQTGIFPFSVNCPIAWGMTRFGVRRFMAWIALRRWPGLARIRRVLI